MSVASSEASRRLFEESLPVFAVLVLWTFLSVFLDGELEGALRQAGLVMALLYVVVRGVTMSRGHETPGDPRSVPAALRDSLRALVPAVPWFLLAFAVGVLRGADPFLAGLVNVASTTGVLTIVLYAVTFGSARLRTTWE